MTDEERSKVAQRLRECRGGWSSGECYYTIIHALGLQDTSREDGGHALYAVLADLIGQEPERTCHYTSFDDYDDEGSGINVWYLSCGHDAINDAPFPPNYCPSCGARVVDE